MNEVEMLPATPEGGGASGAWLRIEYDAVRAIADYPDDLTPIITAVIRWYCGLSYESLKGARRSIFDTIRSSQLRNVDNWTKMKVGGRAGGLKTQQNRRDDQGGFKGGSTPLETSAKGTSTTETEPKPKPRETQPEPKSKTNPCAEVHSESGMDAVVESSANVLKRVSPSVGGSQIPQRRPAVDMYAQLQSDLIGATLEIIGKPTDMTERKAWSGIYTKIVGRGIERPAIVEAVYGWYDGIAKSVDNEPRNRAATLNAYLQKRFGG